MTTEQPPPTECCPTWSDAQLGGTDNECYGHLLRQFDGVDWFIGSNLPPVRYCPWCGKGKVEQKPQGSTNWPCGPGGEI